MKRINDLSKLKNKKETTIQGIKTALEMIDQKENELRVAKRVLECVIVDCGEEFTVKELRESRLLSLLIGHN